MKVKLFIDKNDGTVYGHTEALAIAEEIYFEVMCEKFLENFTTESIIDNLIYDDDSITKQDFNDFKLDYFESELDNLFNIRVCKIVDEDIVE